MGATSIRATFNDLAAALCDACSAHYGGRDVDFISTDQYTGADAARAIADATLVVQAVGGEIDR